MNQNRDMSMATRRNVQISRAQHFSRPCRPAAVRLCLLASFALLLRPAFTGYVQQRRPSTITASQAGEAGWWDQLVWNAAETLGNARASLVGSEPEMPMAEAPSSRDELVERLRADYDRNYFLTGDIDVPLYTDDCEFADPFTSFRGRQRFVQNLKKLSLEWEASWFQHRFYPSRRWHWKIQPLVTLMTLIDVFPRVSLFEIVISPASSETYFEKSLGTWRVDSSPTSR